MARYSAGCKTSAGTATQPQISLYAIAGAGARIREIGCFNTTSTATDIKLVRLTDTGTQGTGLAETKHDPESVSASCTTHNTHSAPVTSPVDLGYRASLGAAVGAGVIWTFGGDSGLRVQPGTGNGIGVVPADGATGQPLQAYIVWDE